jgi:hypothetical protein
MNTFENCVKCECRCRHIIRWILRTVSLEKLQEEKLVDISLEEANAIIEHITNLWINRSNELIDFSEMLEKMMNKPCSILQSLHKCQCCQRHQTKRYIEPEYGYETGEVCER